MKAMYKKIKTFEGACKKRGISTTLPDFSFAPEEDRAVLEAHYKLCIIAAALNDGWKPNWDDVNETKYYPWFWMDSARGFSYGVFVGGHRGSVVGSRLCFKSSAIAEYAGTQFLELYRIYFTYQNQ